MAEPVIDLMTGEALARRVGYGGGGNQGHAK